MIHAMVFFFPKRHFLRFTSLPTYIYMHFNEQILLGHFLRGFEQLCFEEFASQWCVTPPSLSRPRAQNSAARPQECKARRELKQFSVAHFPFLRLMFQGNTTSLQLAKDHLQALINVMNPPESCIDKVSLMYISFTNVLNVIGFVNEWMNECSISGFQSPFPGQKVKGSTSNIASLPSPNVKGPTTILTVQSSSGSSLDLPSLPLLWQKI